MSNELEELVWIARQEGVGSNDVDYLRATRMARASFRKMSKEASLSRMGSPMNAEEDCRAQKANLSLLASHQISTLASVASQSSVSKRQTPSSLTAESANQSKSFQMSFLM